MNSAEFDLLYKVICEVESGNNPYSFRVEHTFTGRIKAIDRAFMRASRYLNASPDDVRLYLATSVGRIQILIYNLFHIDRLYWLCNIADCMPSIPWVVTPDLEKEVLSIFLQERDIYYFPFARGADLTKFAKVYNGSVEYADKLIRAYNRIMGEA